MVERQKIIALRLPENPSSKNYNIWPIEFSSDLSDVQHFLQSPYEDFKSNISKIHEFFSVIDDLISHNNRLDSEVLSTVIPIIEMFQEKLREEGKLGRFRHYGRIRQLNQYIKRIQAQLPEMDEDIFENKDRVGEQLGAFLGDPNQVHIEANKQMAQEIERKKMNTLNGLLDAAQTSLSGDFSVYSEYVDWFDVPEESKHLLSVPELGVVLRLYQAFLSLKDEDEMVASVFRTWMDRIVGFSIIATDIIEDESIDATASIQWENLIQEVAHTVGTLMIKINKAPTHKQVSLDEVLRNTLRGILENAA